MKRLAPLRPPVVQHRYGPALLRALAALALPRKAQGPDAYRLN